MGEEKVTTMVLKVDLQCEKCYKKVKKVLCKFPQIRDQTYDETNNQVIIKVVCCNPEKIRDKLCCKGRGAITSIEIKELEKPIKVVDKPVVKPKPIVPLFPTYPPVTVNACCIVCYGGYSGCPCQIRDTEKSKPTPPPVTAYCPVAVNACCMDCYGGHPGGPCQTRYGYGGSTPYIQFDGYYGRVVYDSYGGGRSYNTSSYCVTRLDCFSEENPQACAIM